MNITTLTHPHSYVNTSVFHAAGLRKTPALHALKSSVAQLTLNMTAG